MDNVKKYKINQKVHERLKTHNTVKESINEINNALDLLLNEDLSFAKSIDNPNINNNVDTVPQQKNEIQNNNPMPSSVKNMINSIRKISLEGIRELSDNSTSEEYIFFKKVWDMADKVQENKKNENIKR